MSDQRAISSRISSPAEDRPGKVCRFAPHEFLFGDIPQQFSSGASPF